METNHESSISQEMTRSFKELVRSVGIIDDDIWLTRCLDFHREICSVICLYSPPQKDLEGESEKVIISYKGEKRYVSPDDLVGCVVSRRFGQDRRGMIYLSDYKQVTVVIKRTQNLGAILEVLELPRDRPMNWGE